MKATIKMLPHIVCPSCGKDDGFRCDNIVTEKPGRFFGPWYCDGCGAAITGSRADNGDIEIEVRNERKIDTIDLLVLEPQDKPVYFLVPGSRYEGGHWDDDSRTEDESKQYHYDESSCPTNWLHPEAIRIGGDNDPHGLIKYLGYRDYSALPPSDYGCRQAWEYFTVFDQELRPRGDHQEPDDSDSVTTPAGR